MHQPLVLLTGASGSMGFEALEELMRRGDRYRVRLLLRPSAVNRKRFDRYLQSHPKLEICWGDLTHAGDAQRAVGDVDFVLHPAAMISPAADRHPELAREINVGGTRNLLDAIRQQPGGADRIRFVYIGSVAQYGDRLPPYENIRVGDPLKPSQFDYYSLSKCEAESLVIESGLKYWASLRQTYIAIPDALSLLDGILFHQPINQHIELITGSDAGYGLVQCLETGDDFWGRVYNMSGGPNCRVVYVEYLERMMDIFGVRDYRKVMDRNWFALRNFHCGYFTDSHELDLHLGHFRDTIEDHYRQVEQSTSTLLQIGARICPNFIMRAVLRRMAEPMDWIKENNEPYVNAFFGSREAWEKIPDWDVAQPSPQTLSETT